LEESAVGPTTSHQPASERPTVGGWHMRQRRGPRRIALPASTQCFLGKRLPHSPCHHRLLSQHPPEVSSLFFCHHPPTNFSIRVFLFARSVIFSCPRFADCSTSSWGKERRAIFSKLSELKAESI